MINFDNLEFRLEQKFQIRQAEDTIPKMSSEQLEKFALEMFVENLRKQNLINELTKELANKELGAM